tara:strand:+ start:10389 stop:10871 length:483 start_codon:yes stop_codon:yes gene_type:complete
VAASTFVGENQTGVKMHVGRKRYYYRGICGRVVDGDTLHARLDLGFGCWKQETIRLYGIDTPEKRMVPGGTEDLKALGVLATEFVRRLIPQNGEIFVETHIDRGKYGRTLGEIWVGDNEKSINEMLEDERLAVPYWNTSRADILEQHLNNVEYHRSLNNL